MVFFPSENVNTKPADLPEHQTFLMNWLLVLKDYSYLMLCFTYGVI